MWLHHTRIEGLPPWRWRLQRAERRFSAPRNISVPSCRPTQRRGCTFSCASSLQVRVRGSPQSPAVTFAFWIGARAGVQSNAQGRGTVPMCSGVRQRKGCITWQSTVARLAHRDPVRPQARLLPSLNSGERCRDRTPRLVSTYTSFIDCSGQLMRQDRQCLARAVFFL
jgi:hypothetical protein